MDHEPDIFVLQAELCLSLCPDAPHPGLKG